LSKYYILSVFFFFFVAFAQEKEERILLDGIAVLATGESGITPVYYSDSWHLSAFGTRKTIEEAVIKGLWGQYGQEHGVKISTEEILDAAEKQLEFLQEQKGISRLKIEKMAEEIGYNLYDIKKELGSQMLLQKTVEMSFSAHGYLNVSHDEVLDYYTEFPPVDPGYFAIKLGFKKNRDDALIQWEATPLCVKKDEISDKLAAVEEACIGDIFFEEYDEKKDGTIYYKLVEKKDDQLLSFEEAYEEIYRILQGKKYAESYKKMTIGFLDSPLTYYFDEKIRSQCIDFLASEQIRR
jgi:hypothetical protein